MHLPNLDKDIADTFVLIGEVNGFAFRFEIT